tara:strand:- start:162 stop:482 length:321 start_codon:yes stop_codon:yes gene_type:complete
MRDPLGPAAYASPTVRKKKRKPLSTGIYSSVFPKAGVTPKFGPAATPTYPVPDKPTGPMQLKPGAALPATPGPGAVPASAPGYVRPLDKATARKKAAKNLWKIWWA